MSRRVLVVEDEGALGEMVRDNLALHGHDVELVRDGRAALERLALGGVDLVVLDIMLPQVDGFEVLRQLRARGDEVPVLVLSAKARDEDRIRGLELRADDYLTKPFHLRELLLRVDALLRRAVSRPGEIDELRLGEKRVDLRAMRVLGPDGASDELSATEARLLRLLAARPGEVVGRAELVRQLFGPATPLTSRTLDNLVLHLRKLVENDPANPRHLHTVRGVGWRLDPSGSS
ncbi:MAG: response regulator transcription factor [Planctomycetes bacterium]|nr:response regulator transcription factor [Planctomycetota bacterium]